MDDSFFLVIVLFPSLPKSLTILGLLGTGFYLATYPIGALRKWGEKSVHHKKLIGMAKHRLHQLTFDEKKLLQSYVRHDARTRRWNIGSGVVGGLAGIGILSQSSSIGSRAEGLAYSINDWAFEYLKAHPELIATPNDTTEPDAFP